MDKNSCARRWFENPQGGVHQKCRNDFCLQLCTETPSTLHIEEDKGPNPLVQSTSVLYPKDNKGKPAFDKLKTRASDFASTSGFQNFSKTQLGWVLSENETGPISYENRSPISFKGNTSEMEKWICEEYASLLKT
ncbi:hypothetical protein FXO37_25072 [Capsicum annuum]|nr:hypothetical protein FXO37_25072 [Capsicum annuum]